MTWLVVTEGFREGSHGQNAKVEEFDDSAFMLFCLKSQNLPEDLSVTMYEIKNKMDISTICTQVAATTSDTI